MGWYGIIGEKGRGWMWWEFLLKLDGRRVMLICWLLMAAIGAIVCADMLLEPLPGYNDLLCLETEYTHIRPVERRRRIRYFEIDLEDGAVCRIDMGVKVEQAWFDQFAERVNVGDQLVLLAEADENRLNAYEVRVEGQVLLSYEDVLADAKRRKSAALVFWGAVVPLIVPAVCFPAWIKRKRRR